MAFNDFPEEQVHNYSQKCTCMLVLDVSGSMSGAPINELQKGINDFYKDVQLDPQTVNQLELGIIAFGETVECLQPPSLLHDKQPPTLTLNGTTKLVDGVNEGIAKVEERKAFYARTGQPYYRPWVILITDGEPDKGQDIATLAAKIKADVALKKYLFLAIGVQGANMKILNELAADGTKPLMLQGLKFLEFFQWLSKSIAIIARSSDGQKVNLPPANNWLETWDI